MAPIARTFINLGPASTQYEPRNQTHELRNIHPEERTPEMESEPEDNERTDYSYDPEEDIIEIYLVKKEEENS